MLAQEVIDHLRIIRTHSGWINKKQGEALDEAIEIIGRVEQLKRAVETSCSQIKPLEVRHPAMVMQHFPDTIDEIVAATNKLKKELAVTQDKALDAALELKRLSGPRKVD